VTRDPTRYADSFNLYQYVVGLPINYVDAMGLKLTVPDPSDKGFFLLLLQQLCPEGKVRVSGTGDISMSDKYCNDPQPDWRDTSNMGPGEGYYPSKVLPTHPTSCWCICNAIKSDRNFTLERVTTPGGFVAWVRRGWFRRAELNRVCIGTERPTGYAGTGDTTTRPGRVRGDLWIVLGHELCGHAVPNMPHPYRHPYTIRDPVIQLENKIREEHSTPTDNCGCRTG
jgi:hypothetical protein